MIKSIQQFPFNNKVIILMHIHDGHMFGLSRSGCILKVSHCIVDPDKEGKALYSTRRVKLFIQQGGIGGAGLK